MTEYIELHCHSNFSLLDGSSHPEDLVARAVELKMPALAITDHDGLYAAVHFYKEARKQVIKPIIGAELTIDQQYHLTLLARNNHGYSNLCHLISKAQLGHSKGKPTIDEATLANYSSDIICLSGCRRGKIPSLLLAGEKELARATARTYLDIFGRDNFFIEKRIESEFFFG